LTKIRWSPEAADDLERIAEHIRKSNPQVARRIVNTIYNGITTLKRFPNRGRGGRLEGTREIVFSSLPYIVAYRVKHEIVEIVRVYHGAQNWP
jgi:addiction module RelE/StbE family toxin